MDPAMAAARDEAERTGRIVGSDVDQIEHLIHGDLARPTVDLTAIRARCDAAKGFRGPGPFTPGPLVVGTALASGPRAFKFHPLSHHQLKPTVREHWLCPHCGIELHLRRYPAVDPPSMFADCTECSITWEVDFDQTASDVPVLLDVIDQLAEAMRLCMKDLQEWGVIFAEGDPPYDLLRAYDEGRL